MKPRTRLRTRPQGLIECLSIVYSHLLVIVTSFDWVSYRNSTITISTYKLPSHTGAKERSVGIPIKE